MPRRRRKSVPISDQFGKRIGSISLHRFRILSRGPKSPFTDALVAVMTRLVAPRSYEGVAWGKDGLIVVVGK